VDHPVIRAPDPDAILAATAMQASCDWIATFDEAFASPTVPSRLL